MKIGNKRIGIFAFGALFFFCAAAAAHADTLTLTSGSNATTTPNVATSITGFQIVGSATSTTPVKLLATSGTLSMTTTAGLTFNGPSTGSTIYFSGTVANINAALATLKYTRASTGTDTLEVSLVNSGEVFFPGNNHLYKFISGSFTWSQASSSAATQTAYGTSGYLATITSQSENDFVSGRLTGDGWIGGSDSEVEGDWKWVSGPEAGTLFWRGTGGGSAQGGNYAHWNSGEPNQSGDEDCAETYVASGSWNDLSCSSQLGYVAEFGRPGSLPSVVATNISIVTADVPAVTALFPANGAITATTTANLVMGFSKTVSADTGNILIKKYSDDSTVDTIPAASVQVTGNGTNTITIDPSVTLAEGVKYYVVVPGTAFKDSSNNHFDGLTSNSTWAFTTADLTAPVISSVATTSVATTTATIGWNTNEAASSKLAYSVGNSFASSTSETDTSSRVTTHAKSLSNLLACTSYNFKAVSGDAAGNYATSTSSLFTTLGCPGNAPPTSATTTSVVVSGTATSTLSDSGRTISVTTPPNFTATSTSVVIQIQAQDSVTVLDSIGVPGSLSSAAAVSFNVTALVDNDTVLDSFDHPVTISYTYTDADIVGLDEQSLAMYHYHDGAWIKLDDCSIDAVANKITCTTPNFSMFSIFGSPLVAGTSSRRSSGGSIQSQVAALTAMGNITQANILKSEWPQLFGAQAQAATVSPNSSSTTSVRDLQSGVTGTDVTSLQKLLNANGYKLAEAGAGSPGSETTLFGSLTKAALSKFQVAKEITPAVGYFGPITRAKITSLGLSGTWWN